MSDETRGSAVDSAVEDARKFLDRDLVFYPNPLLALCEARRVITCCLAKIEELEKALDERTHAFVEASQERDQLKKRVEELEREVRIQSRKLTGRALDHRWEIDERKIVEEERDQLKAENERLDRVRQGLLATREELVDEIIELKAELSHWQHSIGFSSPEEAWVNINAVRGNNLREQERLKTELAEAHKLDGIKDAAGKAIIQQLEERIERLQLRLYEQDVALRKHREASAEDAKEIERLKTELAEAHQKIEELEIKLAEANEDWEELKRARDEETAMRLSMNEKEQEFRQEIERLKGENTEDTQTREMLSTLLTGVANALKGQPEPLTQHDWSDLPNVAASCKAMALDAVEETERLEKALAEQRERIYEVLQQDAKEMDSLSTTWTLGCLMHKLRDALEPKEEKEHDQKEKD